MKITQNLKNYLLFKLKLIEKMLLIFQTQLLTYLKLSSKPKGLFINFNTQNIVKEIIPIVTKEFAILPKELLK